VEGYEMSEAFDKVMEKAAKQKQMAKERKEMRELSGEVNKLVIEVQPTGLYTVRYSISGPVPEELKGMFTRKERILAIANRRGLSIQEAV
jgi:carotenoid cleavage dioxygenase-like enzyme